MTGISIDLNRGRSQRVIYINDHPVSIISPNIGLCTKNLLDQKHLSLEFKLYKKLSIACIRVGVKTRYIV